jgi:hypothetical protein
MDLDRIPQEIFDEGSLKLDDRMKNFFVTAGLRNTSEDRTGWAIAVSAVFASKIIERSLSQHAQALNESARASERHAASLTKATWVLGFATIMLTIFTGVALYGTLAK